MAAAKRREAKRKRERAQESGRTCVCRVCGKEENRPINQSIKQTISEDDNGGFFASNDNDNDNNINDSF